MSTDGGVLLYGIGEDEHGAADDPLPDSHLRVLPTGCLRSCRTSISEVPFIEPREYPCADDSSKGYLLVIVPQSARAPHQVTVGGEFRFYGRDAKGKRVLSEGEVARLYRRRDEWNQSREGLLDEAVEPQVSPRWTGLSLRPRLRAPGGPGSGDVGQDRGEARGQGPQSFKRSWG